MGVGKITMGNDVSSIERQCAELRQLLEEGTADKAVIKGKADALVATVEDTDWYSRMRDDFDWPLEPLVDKGYYEEAIRLIETILGKEFCSLDQGDLYLLKGICLYHLGRFEEAKSMLHAAIYDDEDYIDEARPYLGRIESEEN